MLLKPLTCAALLAVAVLAAGPAAARSTEPYLGAIATDASTGIVLFEHNADAIGPPASMAKLMTYAVLADQLKAGKLALDTPVTVTREDAKVAALRDSTEVWLREGETFPVEELIYAMMIQSANDAAYTLAHKAGGTVAEFVAEMNAKARALGMTRSTFRSPNGFPPPSRRIADGDLTTPRDFSLLCRYLLLQTDILKYTSVRSRPFGSGIRLNAVLMTNHNHLLGRIQGVDGLKTGFTSGAGFCLSATALRNGHRIIVVMMGSPDPKTRDLNVEGLIGDAFIKVPVTEPPFARGAGILAQPTAPTRPEPASSFAPAGTGAEGPTIHLPGALGK
jgi:D-alanyl-D-alanine carboxypeptidase (penicillin-binding protein 5/6)